MIDFSFYDMPLTLAFAVFFGAYLCGSIPFGLILTRLAGLGDIRAIGSGNIGATNVLRTGNKPIAALTLILDGLKGFVPVFSIPYLVHAPEFIPAAISLAGVAALVGHCFPIWLNFKGGKGVATGLGALFGFSYFLGFVAVATWLVVAVLFRRSSFAALMAFAFVPIVAYCFKSAYLLGPIGVIALIIFWRHHANIQRLLNGTEPKIGHESKKPKAVQSEPLAKKKPLKKKAKTKATSKPASKPVAKKGRKTRKK